MAKFLMLLRTDERRTVSAPPPDLFEAVGDLVRKWTDAGILLDADGLVPTAAAVRIRVDDGEVGTEIGPFDEREAVSAYALLRAESLPHAVELATEFVGLHRQYWPHWHGVSEMRQMLSTQEN
jgi:hypothetical protein